MTNYSFYNVNIGTPLSLALGTTGTTWANSILGRLGKQTNDQVHLREIPFNSQSAEYGWRVVDAVYSQEDDVMSYFRAYDENDDFLAEATFGVNYGSVPSTIGGGFKYKPEFGNRYYVPAQNDFHTPNSGGYSVQVLDLKWPSEGMTFGTHKQGNQHSNLRISFQLLRMNLSGSYPYDSNLPLR